MTTVEYIARHIGAPGETKLLEVHDTTDVPRAGDHVSLNDGWASLTVETVTLCYEPGGNSRWRIEIKMHHEEARTLAQELRERGQ